MLEVVIKSIEYLMDVPSQLTSEAVLAGAIRRGETVGLNVSPKDDPSSEFIIDLKLREHGQEKLIRPGQIIPICETYCCAEGGYGSALGNKHILYHNWRDYVGGMLD